MPSPNYEEISRILLNEEFLNYKRRAKLIGEESIFRQFIVQVLLTIHGQTLFNEAKAYKQLSIDKIQET